MGGVGVEVALDVVGWVGGWGVGVVMGVLEGHGWVWGGGVAALKQLYGVDLCACACVCMWVFVYIYEMKTTHGLSSKSVKKEVMERGVIEV